jgi:hypothetical protein
VCYKIASNFAPSKERLFSIFPFVCKNLHSSSQWVPINNPIFYEGITQDGNRKHFSCHQGGESEEVKKKRGVGGGENIVVSEGFQSTCDYGDQKPFGRHSHVATKFNRHLTTSIKFTCHWTMDMYFNCHKWIC